LSTFRLKRYLGHPSTFKEMMWVTFNAGEKIIFIKYK